MAQQQRISLSMSQFKGAAYMLALTYTSLPRSLRTGLGSFLDYTYPIIVPSFRILQATSKMEDIIWSGSTLSHNMTLYEFCMKAKIFFIIVLGTLEQSSLVYPLGHGGS